MFCRRFPCEHVFWESFSPKMIYCKLGEWDLAVLPMVQQAAMGRFMERPLQDWISAKRQISNKVEIHRCVFCLHSFCVLNLNSPWKYEKKTRLFFFDLLYEFISEFEESMTSETWGSICWTMISYPMCRMSFSRWWLRRGCTVDGGFSGCLGMWNP